MKNGRGTLYPGKDIGARRTLLNSSNHLKVSLAPTFLTDLSVSSVHMFGESRVSVQPKHHVSRVEGRPSAAPELTWWPTRWDGGGQRIKPTQKQLYALYDGLLVLEMHWDKHVLSVFSVTEPSITDQFTATQEVFGEWPFQLFVNTSEWDCSLWVVQINKGSSVARLCWYFYQVLWASFLQTVHSCSSEQDWWWTSDNLRYKVSTIHFSSRDPGLGAHKL